MLVYIRPASKGFGPKKKGFNESRRGSMMKEILTTKDIAEYLKLHEITICKYAAAGLIPGIRIGRVWRFEKETIDKWLAEGQKGKR